MADIDFIFYYWYIGWCQLTVCSKGPIDRLKVRMGLNLLDSIPTQSFTRFFFQELSIYVSTRKFLYRLVQLTPLRKSHVDRSKEDGNFNRSLITRRYMLICVSAQKGVQDTHENRSTDSLCYLLCQITFHRSRFPNSKSLRQNHRLPPAESLVPNILLFHKTYVSTGFHPP